MPEQARASPNVAERERLLPCQHRTLIGELMVQAHPVRQYLDAVRPTQDIDVLVHVETSIGPFAQAAGALETLGHRLHELVDAHTAHRSSMAS